MMKDSAEKSADQTDFGSNLLVLSQLVANFIMRFLSLDCVYKIITLIEDCLKISDLAENHHLTDFWHFIWSKYFHEFEIENISKN